MDPKILVAMLVPIIDGVVKKSRTKLDDLAWEIVKEILIAKGPQIADALREEMIAKGMA